MNIQYITGLLESVKEPISGESILKAGMVKNLGIKENDVSFTLVIPDPSYEHKADLVMKSTMAIETAEGSMNAHIHIEVDPGLKLSPPRPLKQVKNIIAIASGKGGVGKSTFSVNLALALKALGYKVGLLDADLYGPSIPTMLNLKGQRPQIVERDGKPVVVPLEAYGLKTMSIGFVIEPEQAVIMRGPRLAGIIQQFVNDCLWPELDYLIVDLPPSTGDIQLTLVQTVPVTGAVLITTPQDVAVADAIKALNMFVIENIQVPVLGVVENMSWFTPEELPDNKYYIFGKGGGEKLATMGETKLLGQVPLVQAVREGADAGVPIVENADHPARMYFMDVAEKLVKQVDIRNATKEPTKIVQITT